MLILIYSFNQFYRFVCDFNWGIIFSIDNCIKSDIIILSKDMHKNYARIKVKSKLKERISESYTSNLLGEKDCVD